MTIIEQGTPSSDLQSVGAREFLIKAFEPPWTAILEEPPNIALLMHLPRVENEVGLVYKDGIWTIVKGFVGAFILAKHMPKDSAILLHSHPIRSKGKSMPSSTDIYNCSPTARNFIASEEGLTNYFFSMSQDKRDAIFIDPLESAKQGVKMMRKSVQNLERDRVLYESFLSANGADVQIYPWSEVADNKLKELFYGTTV